MEASLFRLTLITVPLISASAAAAQTPGFWLTGLPPGGSIGVVRGLSRDGSVAVGFNSVQPAHPAAGFRWTRAGGREDWGLLPGMPSYTPAFAVDSTGTTMVGWAGENYPADRAFRRVGAGPLENLGVLPGQTQSAAAGVSGDGSIVVGTADHQSGPFAPGEAFRWTESGGMGGLGYLRPNGFRSDARGISRDGSTIVGISQSNGGFGAVEAFRWTQSSGMQELPGFSGVLTGSIYANAVNEDGTVIVGRAPHADGHGHAVRWVNGGLQDLGVFGRFNWHALAVSDSGDVIGGTRTSAVSTAFIWTPATGMRDASEFLSMHGVATPLNYRLEFVHAISGDGLTLAGEARNLLTNVREGFVATIPSSTSAMVLLAPLLCTRRRRACWRSL